MLLYIVYSCAYGLVVIQAPTLERAGKAVQLDLLSHILRKYLPFLFAISLAILE